MAFYWAYGTAAAAVLLAMPQDIRTRYISKRLLLIMTLAAIAVRIFVIHSVTEGLLGCIPGAAVLLIALITKESIGVGDGWMFCITGICLGLSQTMEVMAICLTLMSIYSLFLIIIRKKNRKSRIPVMPWMLIGLILGALI